MNFWLVENGQYVEYRRSGECRQCGVCCCNNEISCQVSLVQTEPKQGEAPEGVKDPADWEGYSAFRAQKLWFWMKFNVRDELRDEPCGGYVDGKCSIWKADDFPAICRYWPVHPKDLQDFPDCGFRFKRIETDDRLTEVKYANP